MLQAFVSGVARRSFNFTSRLFENSLADERLVWLAVALFRLLARRSFPEY